MIRVEVRRDANGAVTAFTVRGHADYAEHGRDLVCAAVSVLTQTAVMGLSGAGAQAHPSYEIDEQTGFLSCRIDPSQLSSAEALKAQAILETMLAGLHATAREYSDFVRVKEVGSR